MRWIGLYYSIIFLFLIYFLIQQFLTLWLITKFNTNTFTSLTFQSLKIKFDDKGPKWIWDFWEYYIAIILSSVITVVFILSVSRVYSKNPLKYLGFIKIRKQDSKWILYFIPVYLVLEVITQIFSLQFEFDLTGAEKYKFLLILGAGVAAPFFEEVLFRGFLLTRMNELTSSKYHWLTLIIVTLLFTIPHFQYNFYQLLVVFCLGLYFGFVKWKTGNLWLAILLHCLNNTIAFYTMLFK